MAEPTLAAQHPTEVWAALGGTITLIGALTAYIWNRQNKDIQNISDDVAEHVKRFESGQKAFAHIGEQFVLLGEQIRALTKEDEYQGQEIDRLEDLLRILERALTVLQTEHKGCNKGCGK